MLSVKLFRERGYLQESPEFLYRPLPKNGVKTDKFPCGPLALYPVVRPSKRNPVLQERAANAPNQQKHRSLAKARRRHQRVSPCPQETQQTLFHCPSIEREAFAVHWDSVRGRVGVIMMMPFFRRAEQVSLREVALGSGVRFSL